MNILQGPNFVFAEWKCPLNRDDPKGEVSVIKLIAIGAACPICSLIKFDSSLQIIMNLSKGIQEQNLQWHCIDTCQCEQITGVKESFHRVIFKENREVVASPSFLNMPDRVDWKACKVCVEEEKKMAAEFKKKFQPFDFNLT